MQEIPQKIATEWLALIFFIIVLALTWVKVNYSRRFIQLFNAVINQRLLRQLMRQELVFSHRASIVLIAVSLLSFSSFAYLSDVTFGWKVFGEPGWESWFKYFITIALIYLIKALSIQLIQILADGDWSLNEYRYNIFLLNKAAGILILPFSLLVAYSDPGVQRWTAIIGLIILAMLFLFRLGRGFTNALRNRVPLFYIILYFCSLEILPLMLLHKVLSI